MNNRIDVMSFDKLDGDLLAPGGIVAEFDLSILTLAKCMEE